MGQNVYHPASEGPRQAKRVTVWKRQVEKGTIPTRSTKQIRDERECYRLGSDLGFAEGIVRESMRQRGVKETKARLLELWRSRRRR